MPSVESSVPLFILLCIQLEMPLVNALHCSSVKFAWKQTMYIPPPHPWCRISYEKLIVTHLIKKYPAFFMEPKSSSPCSQKPVIGPSPEPAERQHVLHDLIL